MTVPEVEAKDYYGKDYPYKWFFAALLLGLAFFVPFILYTAFKTSDRDAACEAIWHTVRVAHVEWSAHEYGCLMTFPDGSTQLIDYEPYK